MSDAGSIEQRLRRLEDLEEIRQLFVDYGQYLDAGDFEAYADLFAADGEVRLGPMGSAQGRDQIKALMEQALAGVIGTGDHLITSPRVQIDGDTATAEVMWTVIQRGPDGAPVVSMIGRHRDELVRENDRWRFRKRRGFVDIPSAMPTQGG